MIYLKTHYPAEFMAARLAVWGGYYSPRTYVAEARNLGLRVKPPHINHSDDAFTLDPDRQTLWMGLGQVRELTHVTIDAIRRNRPFTSLDDFLARARPLHLEAINLIKVNALDQLGDQAAMLDQIEARTVAWPPQRAVEFAGDCRIGHAARDHAHRSTRVGRIRAGLSGQRASAGSVERSVGT